MFFSETKNKGFLKKLKYFFLILETVFFPIKTVINFIKMPCTFCHSLTHTLSKCQADIRQFIQQFINVVAANPYALRQHYLFLNQFTKPVLTLICKRVGLNTSGNKFHLVGKIVKLYFERHSNRFDLNVNIGANEEEILMNQIEQSYNDLRAWTTPENPELNAWCLEMRRKLDTYYTRVFGTNISLSQFLRYFGQSEASGPYPSLARR